MSSRSTILVLGVTLLAAAALPGQGQDPGSEGGMGGFGRPRWRQGGERPGRPLPTAEQLEGPPLPDFFVDRFQLDSGQAAEYRMVYDSVMTATAGVRDSAQSARRAIDQAFQGGDRESARAYFPILRQLGDSLAKSDRAFDERIKQFLSKQQLKDYQHWKDDQRRQQPREP